MDTNKSHIMFLHRHMAAIQWHFANNLSKEEFVTWYMQGKTEAAPVYNPVREAIRIIRRKELIAEGVPKAYMILDEMFDCDREFMGKIMDTPGIAYLFNELIKLAAQADLPKNDQI